MPGVGDYQHRFIVEKKYMSTSNWLRIYLKIVLFWSFVQKRKERILLYLLAPEMFRSGKMFRGGITCLRIYFKEKGEMAGTNWNVSLAENYRRLSFLSPATFVHNRTKFWRNTTTRIRSRARDWFVQWFVRQLNLVSVSRKSANIS